MEKITGLIKKLSEKKYNKFVIIGFFISVFLIENSFFGKGYLENIVANFKMADMNFFNSVDSLIHYLESLGEVGRRGYLTLLSFDFILIVSFFLLQATLIIKLLRGLDQVEKFKWLIVIPFLRSVFDFIETVSLFTATKKFPDPAIIALKISCIATPMKWISMFTGLTLLVTLILINLLRIIQRKSNSKDKQLNY